MIRLLRVFGFLLIAAGTIFVLSWFIKPLRSLWPWIRNLPWPIQVGLVCAAVGFLLLLGTLLWERLEERENDRSLLKP